MFWSKRLLLLQALAPAAIVSAVPLSRGSKKVPDYVTKYAPIVYLQSDDLYHPADFGDFLDHVNPVDSTNTTVPGAPNPLTLNNLDQLNAHGGGSVYLTSKEGIQANPKWFEGETPDDDGITVDSISSAIITKDWGNGTLDAFYFYWYNYNQGDAVALMEFGDHVGDWEHNMIRFNNGEPYAIFYSQHSDGFAYGWNVVEKEGDRPVAYSAKGSHANYPTAGKQDRHDVNPLIPPGFLIDTTDKGHKWDPTGNAYFYKFDNATQSFTPYRRSYPVNWLYFQGHWGDNRLPKGTKGQVEMFGQYKYDTGPTGPFFKNLGRQEMCAKGCEIQWDEIKKSADEQIDAARAKAETEFKEKGAEILKDVLSLF